MKKLPGQSFGTQYNWFEGIQMYCSEPLNAGSIVSVVGMEGGYQRVAPATPGESVGRLLVAKHASPKPQTSIFLPWYVLKGAPGRPIDTTKWEKDALLYLHPGGAWDPEIPGSGPVIPIGHVIFQHESEGAVRLDPGAYPVPDEAAVRRMRQSAAGRKGAAKRWESRHVEDDPIPSV